MCKCMCFLVGIFRLKTPRHMVRAISKTLQPHNSCESWINLDCTYPHPWQIQAVCVSSALVPQFWSKVMHRTCQCSRFLTTAVASPWAAHGPRRSQTSYGIPISMATMPLPPHHGRASGTTERLPSDSATLLSCSQNGKDVGGSWTQQERWCRTFFPTAGSLPNLTAAGAAEERVLDPSINTHLALSQRLMVGL